MTFLMGFFVDKKVLPKAAEELQRAGEVRLARLRQEPQTGGEEAVQLGLFHQVRRGPSQGEHRPAAQVPRQRQGLQHHRREAQERVHVRAGRVRGHDEGVHRRGRCFPGKAD